VSFQNPANTLEFVVKTRSKNEEEFEAKIAICREIQVQNAMKAYLKSNPVK
jgi:hypothetical protein